MLCEGGRTGSKIALTGKREVWVGVDSRPAFIWEGATLDKPFAHRHQGGTAAGTVGGAEVPPSRSMPVAQPCRGTVLPDSACGRSGSRESRALSRHPGSHFRRQAFVRERGSRAAAVCGVSRATWEGEASPAWGVGGPFRPQRAGTKSSGCLGSPLGHLPAA